MSPTEHTITCKLCARQLIAEIPPLDSPLALKLRNKLEAHLKKYHQHEVEQALRIALGFIPFLIWNAFDTGDENIERQIEQIRAPIFAMVKKVSLSDASLEHIVATIGLDPKDAAEVNKAMRGVRDACCELGQFAPTVPAESKILTV